MVDNTKWTAQQLIAAGVLERTPPDSLCPTDAKLTTLNENHGGEEAIEAALRSGGIYAPMCYGLWRIWAAGDKYDGELMQYRQVTDRLHGATLEQAIERAKYWWSVCWGEDNIQPGAGASATSPPATGSGSPGRIEPES